MWNPISCGRVWAALRCAEREVEVGSVRVRMTFLWMSDPLFNSVNCVVEAVTNDAFVLVFKFLIVAI